MMVPNPMSRLAPSVSAGPVRVTKVPVEVSAETLALAKVETVAVACDLLAAISKQVHPATIIPMRYFLRFINKLTVIRLVASQSNIP